MRIIFIGSASIALPTLDKLISNEKYDVVGVISQPDRPSGRKRLLKSSPVKVLASLHGIKVITPENLNDDIIYNHLRLLKPDLFVVIAYGNFIPTKVISLAKFKAINLHPSLLPKYRGASPIQWAIMNGDYETGVTIITVSEIMDAGDILNQKKLNINPNDTTLSLSERCSQEGADLMIKTIEDIISGSVNAIVQDEKKVINTRKLVKSDGIINWNKTAEEINNQIKAFNPWPGSYCQLSSGETLSIWEAICVDGKGKPGEILDDILTISTKKGAIRLLEVQLHGKKRMRADVFLNGNKLEAGSFLI